MSRFANGRRNRVSAEIAGLVCFRTPLRIDTKLRSAPNFGDEKRLRVIPGPTLPALALPKRYCVLVGSQAAANTLDGCGWIY